MNVRTVVRDCLLLHWALPAEVLPPPPSSLRYEERSLEDLGLRVFVTALLSLHQGVQVADLPILGLTYPQFSLALPVLGEDCVPGLLFETVLVPAWVLPAARLVARQPVSTARLSFDRPSEQMDQQRWRWAVEKDGGFSVEARQASPAEGSPVGSWRTFMDSLRQRRQGYYRNGKGVRQFETRVLDGKAWPLAAEVTESGLLERALPNVDKACWQELRSAVLFPELPLETELSLAPQVGLSRPVPQPAGSRRSSVALKPALSERCVL